MHKHLQNNFDIPASLREIDEIIQTTNSYLSKGQQKHTVLLTIYKYVKHIFECFGLNYELADSSSGSGQS